MNTILYITTYIYTIVCSTIDYIYSVLSEIVGSCELHEGKRGNLIHVRV